MIFDNYGEYERWVQTIADNNAERDGSDAVSVAQVCIMSLAEVGVDTAIRMNAEPYLNPSKDGAKGVHTARVPPYDVITHSRDELPRGITDWRAAAVELLARDIRRAERGEL